MKIYDIHIITYTHKHIKYINWNNNRNRLKEIHIHILLYIHHAENWTDREEFQRFLMGGLARTVAERRQYAKKSKMHRKLAILLDRISFGIDRRTKALHSMFDAVDDDGSGFLTATELRELMAKYADHEGHVPSDEEVMEFMEQIDENGDMKLSKAEFVLFMLHNDDVVDETDSKVGQWRNHALEKVPW